MQVLTHSIMKHFLRTLTKCISLYNEMSFLTYGYTCKYFMSQARIINTSKLLDPVKSPYELTHEGFTKIRHTWAPWLAKSFS